MTISYIVRFIINNKMLNNPVIFTTTPVQNKTKYDIENQCSINKSIMCIITLTILLCVSFIVPFAICDLYYSLNDNTCVDKYSKAANVNMQTYLFISGILEIVLIVVMSVTIVWFTKVDGNKDYEAIVLCCGFSPIIIISLFLFAWDIVGAVVFWGHVYELGNCSQTTSTYIFASLLIKLVLTTCAGSRSLSKKN